MDKQDENELKVDLISAMLELKRRKNTKLAKYNSGEIKHEKQLAFHKCIKRNRWVFGGNRSGKTECGAVEAIWLARGIHPFKENKPNVSGWVVSLTSKVQKEVAQDKILSYLDSSWIEDIVIHSCHLDFIKKALFILLNFVKFWGGRFVFWATHNKVSKFIKRVVISFIWSISVAPKIPLSFTNKIGARFKYK